MRNVLLKTFTVLLSMALYANLNAFYVIQLRNGNEITTNRYWREGEQILFETAGGTFGIEKESIGNIHKSTRPTLPAAPLTRMADGAREPDQIKAAEKRNRAKTERATQAPAQNADPILREFDNLKGRVAGLKGMLTSELVELTRDVGDFRRRVRQSDKVNDYIEQLAETSAMEDDLAEELRSRGQ